MVLTEANVVWGEVVDGGDDMSPGDDQEVFRRLRRAVAKGDELVILESAW